MVYAFLLILKLFLKVLKEFIPTEKSNFVKEFSGTSVSMSKVAPAKSPNRLAL